MANEEVLDPNSAVPYYAGTGFLEPPAAFLAGNDNINACLVGRMAEGVVVAFRGTLPPGGPFTLPKLLDWINDFNVAPEPEDALPGRVHGGFLRSLDSLWGSVSVEVARQLQRSPADALVMVTGHSKGGGIAPLAVRRLVSSGIVDAAKIKVVTFAAPKSGDSAFAADYNARIRDHTRFEFADDIVPHLPPSAPLLTVLSTVTFLHRTLSDLQRFDYERVGSLMDIDRSFNITPAEGDEQLPARRRSIANLILRGHVQQIADDHHAACKFGYMTALCPSGVCPPPLSTT
jgi:hypothetical protein